MPTVTFKITVIEFSAESTCVESHMERPLRHGSANNADYSRQVTRAARAHGVHPVENLPVQEGQCALVAWGYDQHIALVPIGNTIALPSRNDLPITEDAFQRAVQNRLQPPHGSGSQDSPQKPQNLASSEKSEVCGLVKTNQVERRTLEPGSNSSGNTALSATGGAESGAVGAPVANFPPDLGVVTAAWLYLSDADRKAIVQIIRRAAMG